MYERQNIIDICAYQPKVVNYIMWKAATKSTFFSSILNPNVGSTI